MSITFPFFQTDETAFTAFAVSSFLSLRYQSRVHTAFGSDGLPLLLPDNPAAFQLKSQSQLAQLGSEMFGEGVSALQTGWVQLMTDNPNIGSFFQFGDNGLMRLDGSVAFTGQAKKLYFTRVFEGATAYRAQPAQTFVSIANPNTDPIQLELKLHAATDAQTHPEKPTFSCDS